MGEIVIELLSLSTMNKSEAIEIAKAEAELKGWQWKGIVEAECSKKWLLFGPKIWKVRSNANMRGVNVFVRIDDSTREILASGFGPR